MGTYAIRYSEKKLFTIVKYSTPYVNSRFNFHLVDKATEAVDKQKERVTRIKICQAEMHILLIFIYLFIYNRI